MQIVGHGGESSLLEFTAFLYGHRRMEYSQTRQFFAHWTTTGPQNVCTQRAIHKKASFMLYFIWLTGDSSDLGGRPDFPIYNGHCQPQKSEWEWEREQQATDLENSDCFTADFTFHDLGPVTCNAKAFGQGISERKTGREAMGL